ncbi:E3 ubiquitin-protein ligase znrf2-like [Mya arenaria]|uniref:E3 ubiquitin-protein ligase znrf2-like n=1 Tax=Mya arenaria TaxID=6604 RepID=UPI0022E69191|nr:E3 ubiquitin-protein ligase znrf2-like [Mya arenaria]
MGAKQSSGANTPSRVRTYSGSHNGAGPHVAMGGSHSSGSRARARSLGSFATPPAGLGIPSLGNGNGPGAVGGSPDSDSSPDEPGPLGVAHAHALRNITHSLPVHLFALHGIKCPVCSKFVPPEDIECHLVVCLTKPRITYNDDVLTESKGECVICFDELDQGDTIARLPCLCIYHKGCIDKWFEKNRSCPEHPND